MGRGSSQRSTDKKKFGAGMDGINWDSGKKPEEKGTVEAKDTGEGNLTDVSKCKNCGSNDTVLKPTVGGKIEVVCTACKNKYHMSAM